MVDLEEVLLEVGRLNLVKGVVDHFYASEVIIRCLVARSAIKHDTHNVSVLLRL